MLKTRVKTAAVLVVLALPILWLSYIPFVINGFAVAIALMAVFELYRGAGLLKKDPLVLVALAGAVVIPQLRLEGYIDLLALVFPLILLAFLMAMLRQDEMPVPGRIATFCLSMAVCLFFGAIPRLRRLPFGLLNLVMMVLVCVATDAAAYFVGRARGRHKLAPTVSPNKTIEGALGGTVTAILAAMLMCVLTEVFSDIRVNYAAVVLYAAVTSVVGQMGDLSMSLIKRRVGIKDFGTLLPGHGGILDRFDSQSFAAPFTLIFVESICPLFVR
ncbi:MAG: phosphatidate cytidylyltransferase [Eubacteriales bacterium]|nr:phosphatidate cytidylyltransferase [Eubacteriales bacterium]